jgi:photosystem II stability/assembly factor-like uncharacterized protein
MPVLTRNSSLPGRRRVLLSAVLLLAAVAVVAFLVGRSSGGGGANAAAAGNPVYETEPPKSSSDTIHTARLIAPGQAWALTSHGLVSTGDSGASWHPITPPGVAAEEILAVDFADPTHGWVAAPGRKPPPQPTLSIFATTDGGRSWKESEIPIAQTAVGSVVLAATGENLWALVNDQGAMSTNRLGGLYMSGDGGSTWRQLPRPPLGVGRMEFVSATEGWLEGGVGTQGLWQTTDGGSSWSQVSFPAPAGFEQSRTGYGLPQIGPDGSGVLPVTFSRPGAPSEVTVFATATGGRQWAPVSTTALQEELTAGEGSSVAAPRGADSVVVTEAADKGLTVLEAPNASAAESSPIEPLVETTAPATGLPPESSTRLEFVDPRHGLDLVDKTICLEEAPCVTDNRLLFSQDGGRSWQNSSVRP